MSWTSFTLLIITLLGAGNALTIPNSRGDVELVRDQSSRRGFIGKTLGVGASLAFSQSALAAPSQDEIDKANIVKGYKRLTYLLDNWEKETTVCGMGGDKLERSCDRTPEKVMEYMGYKSTKDPLYKAEKTLRRLYENAPPKRDSEFVEAVEKFAENADDANGLAFVSSWGEANPGKTILCIKFLVSFQLL